MQMIQAQIRGETQELKDHAPLSCVVGAGPCPPPPPPRALLLCSPPLFSLEVSPCSHPSPHLFLLPASSPWKDAYSWTLYMSVPVGPSAPPVQGRWGPEILPALLGEVAHFAWQPFLLLTCDLGTHIPGTLLFLDFRSGGSQWGESWGGRLLSWAYRPYLQRVLRGVNRYLRVLSLGNVSLYDSSNSLVGICLLPAAESAQMHAQDPTYFLLKCLVWSPCIGTHTPWRDAGPASL